MPRHWREHPLSFILHSMNPQIQIRSQILLARRKLNTEELKLNSETACQRLLHLPEYADAEKIAVYFACNGEIELDGFIQQASDDLKDLYLPVVDDNGMHFTLYRRDMPMQANRFGIYEPEEKHYIDPAILDISITPLVAFDTNLNRIGMGGGYYDKAFAALKQAQKPLRVGMAHAIQQVKNCYANDWDIPLHAVVTEKSTFRS